MHPYRKLCQTQSAYLSLPQTPSPARYFTQYFLGVFSALALSGCAGNIKLLEDGKVHQGRFQQGSNTLEIDIEGVRYSGTYSQNMSVGIGTGFAGRSAFTGSFVGSDGGGQALMTSPSGKVLRCVFGSVVALRGQGACETNDGKRYDMLISP